MDRRFRVIGWVAAACFAIAATGAVTLWLSQPTPLRQAQAAYERRDWRTAGSLARQWLREHPNDANAQRLLARALFHQGRDESARSIYDRIGMQEMQAEDCARLAAYLTRAGQADAALRVLEEGLAKDPAHPEVLSELTRLYAASDRLYEALELARRLQSVAGWSARAHVLVALIEGQLGNNRDAAAAWEAALQADPRLAGAAVSPATAWKQRARAGLALRRPVEPQRALERLLSSSQTPDSETLWLMSRSRLQENDLANAADFLRRSGVDQEAAFVEPAPFIGAARCATCHREIHLAQQQSHHASTFLVGKELLDIAFPAGGFEDIADSSVRHSLRNEGENRTFTTERAGRTAEVRLVYAFGSDDRGTTPVGLDDRGNWRELRLSHYGGHTWDVTTGHAKTPPEAGSGDPHAFLGRPLGRDAVRRCLTCHTTNVREPDVQGAHGLVDRGIGCEACHGPGGNHVLAVKAPNFPDLAIAARTDTPGKRIVALCATCHSPRAAEVHEDDPASIRFQATTLTWSRCYKQSRGALSCVTCHDPHRDAEANPVFYEAKCLACHTQDAEQRSAKDGTRPIELAADIPRTPCPINPREGCIGCHMPTRSGLIPHTSFADHWIRSHKIIR